MHHNLIILQTFLISLNRNFWKAISFDINFIKAHYHRCPHEIVWAIGIQPLLSGAMIEVQQQKKGVSMPKEKIRKPIGWNLSLSNREIR